MPAAFRAAGAVSSSLNAATPALPAGIQVDDILLLVWETSNQNGTAAPTSTVGTWAEVTGSPQGTGTAGTSGSGTGLRVFWARVVAGFTAPTMSDSGDHNRAVILAYSGCVTSGNPWDVTNGGVEAASDTSGTDVGVTTTVAGELVVVVAACGTDSTTTQITTFTNASLAGLAKRAGTQITTGSGGGAYIADGTLAAAGASGATTWTQAAASPKAFLTIALLSQPATSAAAGAALGTGTAPQPIAAAGLYAATVAADGPSVYYRLGDAAAPAVSCAGGVNAAATGTPTFGAAGGIAGDPDTAVSLPGSAGLDYLGTASSPGTAYNLGDGPWSIEFWYKWGGYASGQTIANSLGKGTNAFVVRLNSTGKWVIRKSGTGDCFFTTASFNDQTAWHHVVITRALATQPHIYVDGADQAGTHTAQTFADTSTAFTMGVDAAAVTVGAWLGLLDEVALYKSVLSQAQVSAHYAAGAPSGTSAGAAAGTGTAPAVAAQTAFSATAGLAAGTGTAPGPALALAGRAVPGAPSGTGTAPAPALTLASNAAAGPGSGTGTAPGV